MPTRSSLLHKSYLDTRPSAEAGTGLPAKLAEVPLFSRGDSVASDRYTGRSCADHWLFHCYLVTFKHNRPRLWEMATWPPAWIATHHIHVLIFLFLSTARLTGATPTFNIQNVGQIPYHTLNDLPQRFRSSFHTLATLTRQQYVRAISGQLGAWDMVQLIAACTLIGAFRLWKQRRTSPQDDSKADNLLGGDTRRSLDSTRGSPHNLRRSSKSGELETSLAVT